MQMVAVDRWSVERPSLAYHWAFDLCAVEANRGGGTAAVFASSLFYARELTRRLTGDVVLRFTNNWKLDDAEVGSAMGPEIDWKRVHLDTGKDSRDSVHTVLWAEPEIQTWKNTLRDIQLTASCITRICILGTTKWRRLLPEWQQAVASPACAPLQSHWGLVKTLRRLEYSIEEIYGVHGPLSLLLGSASRLPAMLKRYDLVDRCFVAMRQSYIVRGWQARWSPVWMIVGKCERDLGNMRQSE